MNQNRDLLNLSKWALPTQVLEHYKKKGILSMFPWQLECLSLGRVLDGENLVYSAPTSAGKTLVAEILISQTVFNKKKKALVILPFVSVVREKMFYFQDMFSSNGIRVEGFMGGHTPSASFQQVQVAVCTIEKANALINRMMEEKKLSELGIVVVDELHLLGDQYRGYLLELLLTKIKYMSSKNKDDSLQIIGMSATLPNLHVLAKWLNANLYYTDFRPIPLAERLKCGKDIFNAKLEKVSELDVKCLESGDDSENVGYLCLETIRHGHSVLIFCPTKVWCENLAVKLASYFRKLGCSPAAQEEGSLGWAIRRELDLKKINGVVEHLKICPVGFDKELSRTVPFGVGFHHAGLTLDERDIIEGSFRNGSLRVLCATSTLSSGVNLPARRVIIRSPMSFGGVMDILTYRQMIGRAGRMGVDSEGESILICKPSEKTVCQQLLSSNLKPIESCLGCGRLSASLKRAILEVVASGVASTPDEISAYAGSTFLAASARGDMNDPLTSCLEFLEENEMVRLVDGIRYVPTPLGQACLASSLPPDEGLALFKELERARRCFVLDSDLHIIYQVTPYSVSEQWSKIDWLRVLNMLEDLSPSMRRVAELVGVEDAFLVKVLKGSLKTTLSDERRKLSIHRRFYTALALQELVNEVPLPEVAHKFDCNKGMLQSLQQSSATYAGMVAEFCRRLRWETMELIVSQFQERLQFGVQRELCELMKLASLNGVRARTLFNAGFTNLSSVANAECSAMEAALIASTPFQSKGQMPGEDAHEYEQRAKAQAIWVTGRAGLTAKEAALILIKEARDVLQLELGVDAKWEQKEDNSSQPLINNADSCSNVPEHKIMTENPNGGLHEPVESENSSENNLSSHIIVPTSQERNSISCKNDERLSQGNILLKNNSDCQIEKIATASCQNQSKSPAVVSQKSSVRQSPEIEKTNVRPFKKEDQNVSNSNLFTNCKLGSLINEKIVDTDFLKDRTIEKPNLTPVSREQTCVAQLLRKSLRNQSPDLGKRDLESDLFGATLTAELLKSHWESPTESMIRKSRFSTDLFDVSPKPCSTPLSERATASLNSPDLFSQSLTFDTQLQQVCDSEDIYVPDDGPPTSPPKSDDLGFFSQSSQLFVEDALMIPDTPRLLETVNESFFIDKNCAKRKASPDTIAGSDDSLCESSRRQLLQRRKSTKKRRTDVMVVTLDDSDEEIAPTPKFDATVLSRQISKETQPFHTRRNIEAQAFATHSDSSPPCDLVCSAKSVATSTSPSNSGMDWESFNIVDVCGEATVFKSFCCELSEKGRVSFALGCRERILKKNGSVGPPILQKSSVEIEESQIFQNENVVLSGIAFYWGGNDVFYVNMEETGLSQEEKMEPLRELNIGNKDVIIYDTREQLKSLKICTGCSVQGALLDPKIGGWLCGTTGGEPNFLSLISEFLLPEATALAEHLGNVPGGGSPGLLVSSPVSAKNRSTIEAILTYHLMDSICPKLMEKRMLETFGKVEMPLQSILAEMEVTGFQFNKQKLISMKNEFDDILKSLEFQAHKFAGRKFALSSYAAIKKVLYIELRLGKSSNGAKKTNSLSTSKEALEMLHNETGHPLPLVILQWRKVKCTLVKVLFPLLQILPKDRVHGSCQTFTVTGRISMREPNIQNIPRDFEIESFEGNAQKGGFISEKDEIKKICLRDIFVAADNYVLLSVDYCQMELRLLAHLAQDPTLINTITTSQDVFISIASSIHSIPEIMVTDEQRQQAKQTCYGIVYGIGAKTLSVQLRVEESVAQQLMDDFKAKYPGIKSFLTETVQKCCKKGFVETLGGRRRYLPAINSDNPAIRSEAERQAVNTKVQGSAADLVKRAMVKFCNASKSLDVRLVLHLHDELIYEVEEASLMKVAVILKNAMETSWTLSLPFPVKVRCGPSWGQLRALKTDS